MMTHSKSEPSGLHVDLAKLLSASAMHLDQAQRDAERLRARLASVPWQIADGEQDLLEEVRGLLFQVERKLLAAKKQLAKQKNRATKKP